MSYLFWQVANSHLHFQGPNTRYICRFGMLCAANIQDESCQPANWLETTRGMPCRSHIGHLFVNTEPVTESWIRHDIYWFRIDLPLHRCSFSLPSAIFRQATRYTRHFVIIILLNSQYHVLGSSSCSSDYHAQLGHSHTTRPSRKQSYLDDIACA